jgi:hypothetical protein
VDKRRFRTDEASSFQKIVGADRVHIKVVMGPASGEIVARLAGSMDDGRWLYLFEEPQYSGPVSDIKLMMVEILEAGLQTLPVPTGIALRTKKISPHIIVDPVHDPALPAKIRDDFTADKAA